MNSKLRGEKESKIEIVTSALLEYCNKSWPLSYYDKPIRLGIVSFSRPGVLGETKFDVIVPLYPSPVSLELFRLQEISAKGSGYVSDGLRYGTMILRESNRSMKRIDLITGGYSEGPDPIPMASNCKDLGIFLNVIEIGDSSTQKLREVASQAGGAYWLVQNKRELLEALE